MQTIQVAPVEVVNITPVTNPAKNAQGVSSLSLNQGAIKDKTWVCCSVYE